MELNIHFISADELQWIFVYSLCRGGSSYNGAEDFKFKIGDQMEILEEHQASFSKRASLILYFGEN